MKSIIETIPNLRSPDDEQSGLQGLGQSEDLYRGIKSRVLELEVYYKRKLCELRQQFEQKETILHQEITALQCELADAREEGGPSGKLRQRSAWSTPREPNLRKMVIDTLRESIRCMQSLMNMLGQEQERSKQLQYQLACVQEYKYNNTQTSNMSKGTCMANESSIDYKINRPSSSHDVRPSFQKPNLSSMIYGKNEGLAASYMPKQQSRLLPNSQQQCRKGSIPPLEVQNYPVREWNEKQYKGTSPMSDVRSRGICMMHESAGDKVNNGLSSIKNVRFSLQRDETGNL